MVHVRLTAQDDIVTVVHDHSEICAGLLELHAAKALAKLHQAFRVTFNAYVPGCKGKKSGQRVSSKLFVLLYGMRGDAELVGKVLSDADIFLQHPIHQDSSVLYHNPHYLIRPGGFLVVPEERAESSRMSKSSDVLLDGSLLKGRIDEVLDSVQGPQDYSEVVPSARIATQLKRLVPCYDLLRFVMLKCTVISEKLSR
jgi:hypothetical protein